MVSRIIDSDEPHALPDVSHRLQNIAADLPDAIAGYTPDEEPVTFGELAAVAAALENHIPDGVERVAVMLPTSLTGVAALFAIWARGASAVLMNSVLPEQEANRRVNEVGADLLLRRSGDEWIATRYVVSADCEARPSDELVVFFTSGTTGRPKGVSKSARAVGSMVQMVGSAGGHTGGRWPAHPPRRPYLVMSPLDHLQGLLGGLVAWQLGQPLLMIEKFNTERVFDIVHRHDIRTLRLGPAMVYDLVAHAGGRDLGNVQAVTVGTAELPEALRQRFEEQFGVVALRTYGQTESGAIAFERFSDARDGHRPAGSVGKSAPGVEIQIVDASGDRVSPGEIGEICVKGPEAMSGYVHDSDADTATHDGFIATGDLGRFDDQGFLYITGRARDVIICGGFNVYPAMVEEALHRIPTVREAVVVGVADDRLGEVPIALVRTDRDIALDVEVVRQMLRADLSPYELPKQFRFVAEIPRTANGKPNREAAREVFEAIDADGTAAESHTVR